VFMGKLGAYPTKEHLKDSSLRHRPYLQTPD
jgi:hypothetical protein